MQVPVQICRLWQSTSTSWTWYWKWRT